MKESHWATILNLGLNLDCPKTLINAKEGFYESLYSSLGYYSGKCQRLSQYIDLFRINRDPKLIPVLKEIERTGILAPDFQAVLTLFKNQGATIYRIAHDFGFELNKANLRVKPEYILMRNEIVCFEFPRAMQFKVDDKHYSNCAYVYISSEIPDYLKDKKISASVHLFMPLYRLRDSQLSPSESVSLRLNIYSDREIEDSLHELSKNNFGKVISAQELVSFILKCLLYVSSGEPDLRHKMVSKKQKRSKRYKQFFTDSKMILMGFQFAKTKTSEDNMVVCGHPRWQPYGKDRLKIKLIWINSYERSATNEKDHSL